MFVASRPGEFLVTLINTKKDCFIRDNILCIFETNYESSYEKECCMSYIGVNPDHIGLIKYVVFLNTLSGTVNMAWRFLRLDTII